MGKVAILRACASCEWIFKRDEKVEYEGCPKCGFCHYGARQLYGKKAYDYAKTQAPWIESKMDRYYDKLLNEVLEYNKINYPSTEEDLQWILSGKSFDIG